MDIIKVMLSHVCLPSYTNLKLKQPICCLGVHIQINPVPHFSPGKQVKHSSAEIWPEEEGGREGVTGHSQGRKPGWVWGAPCPHQVTVHGAPGASELPTAADPHPAAPNAAVPAVGV